MRESYGEGPASHTGPQPSAMRLSRLTDAEWKDGGGVSLYAYRYDYDLVGNHTKLLYNGTPTYYAYNGSSPRRGATSSGPNPSRRLVDRSCPGTPPATASSISSPTAMASPSRLVAALRHRAGGISLTPRSGRRILALVAARDRGW